MSTCTRFNTPTEHLPCRVSSAPIVRALCPATARAETGQTKPRPVCGGSLARDDDAPGLRPPSGVFSPPLRGSSAAASLPPATSVSSPSPLRVRESSRARAPSHARWQPAAGVLRPQQSGIGGEWDNLSHKRGCLLRPMRTSCVHRSECSRVGMGVLCAGMVAVSVIHCLEGTLCPARNVPRHRGHLRLPLSRVR